MEIIDDWEWVIYGRDLENGKIKLEDPETTCALVREIGTDSPNTISFGVEDIVYIRINKLIAPFYKASYNLNRMQFSKIRDGKWVTTGFELPIPLDREIMISGLDPDKRIYLRGTLFKGVLRADHPINRYLRARMVEVPYKRLHPILFENVEIPSTFGKNKKFILRTDGVATPRMEEWDVTNPHYTIVPEKNTKYILNNPIEVLWNHEELPPEGVEFRIWYDGTEDLKVRPRLDHMFLPPSDGKSVWTEEKILVSSSQIKAKTVQNAVSAGYNVKVTVDGGVAFTDLVSGYEKYVPGIFAPGQKVMIAQSGQAEICTITEVVAHGETSADIYLDKVENDYLSGVAKVYAPVCALDGQPIEPADFKVKPSGAQAMVDPATGFVFVDTPDVTSGYVIGYYRHKTRGGKDIFTMAKLPRKYRELEDPHKLTFMFVNVYGDITKTGTFTLYTLAQLYKTVPPEVAEAVRRTWAEVSGEFLH